MPDIWDWSTTAADNDDADSSLTWAEGQTPGSVNNSARMMMKRVADFLDDLGGVGTVGGTADALTLTSAQASLATGKVVAFKAGSANTGAATLNVNSLGAKAIRRRGDTALSANDMIANGRYICVYDAAYNSSAGAWVLLNPETPTVIGKQTIWVPAAAMIPATTNGAARGTSEKTTNKQMVATLDFDASTEEFAQFSIAMPVSWNESTITAIFYWSHGATVTNFGVAWGLEALATSNDDAIDASWGTEVVTTDTGGTTDDVYVTSESNAVTAAGTPATGDVVWFRVTRVVGDAGDTMAVDAKLIGVKILYTINAGNDA